MAVFRVFFVLVLIWVAKGLKKIGKLCLHGPLVGFSAAFRTEFWISSDLWELLSSCSWIPWSLPVSLGASEERDGLLEFCQRLPPSRQ